MEFLTQQYGVFDMVRRGNTFDSIDYDRLEAAQAAFLAGPVV